MAPNFEPSERKELESSPLELVVCQLRFPSVLALIGGKPPEDFQKALAANYPIAQPKQNTSIEVTPAGVSQTVSTVWTFEDIDSNWTVSLAPTFLALEAKRYERFSDFRDRFLTLVGVVAAQFGVTIQERLGLRYVDHISKSRQPFITDDWPDKICPPLLPARSWAKDGEALSTTGDHRFFKDDCFVAIRAMFTSSSFPGSTEDRLVLDLDCYTEKRASIEAVAAKLDTFKESGYAAFRWAIGDLIDSFPEAR